MMGQIKIAKVMKAKLEPRIKILVITDISVLGFYEYIDKISLDILTKILVKRKSTKIL